MAEIARVARGVSKVVHHKGGLRFLAVLAVLMYASPVQGQTCIECQTRRQRALEQFRDGVLVIRGGVASELNDGFRQAPVFYYFTGLENTPAAYLLLDGRSGQVWLFVPTKLPFDSPPEVIPGEEAQKRLGIDHVVDWSELRAFFDRQANTPLKLYFLGDLFVEELPSNISGAKDAAPAWVQVLRHQWPNLSPENAQEKVSALMLIQSLSEQAAVRRAAAATVNALRAGIRAVRPGTTQRSIEVAVDDACWNSGARGSAFWPWAMAGSNAVFPHPFWSAMRYDHLDKTLRSGELVRLDVGCEWAHYGGDLGRTLPVSGHFDEAQRETWDVFVAAYRGAAGVLREGVTPDEVFAAWSRELLGLAARAKTQMARRAIEKWSERKNVPFWQIHTTGLVVSLPTEALRAGTTINFEPIADIDGQGFFIEDMYTITKTGAELLTPGLPYTADEIAAAMSSSH